MVDNEVQSVEVSVFNLSSQPVSSITFIWEKDGQLQPSYTWTPVVPLATLESANVKIDEFGISADHDVRIWATVNEHADTVDVSSEIIPLAEFAQPFVEDTVFKLSFDIYTQINSATGALTVNPQMYLKSIVNNSIALYDTIDMVLEDDLWVTHVPQQYYNTKVIYSVTVSDTLSPVPNTITLMDSTFIKFMGLGKNDTVIVGTGTATSNGNPYNAFYDFSYSRNYYMANEISATGSGGIITDIAFYHTATACNVDNVSFYFKATADAANTSSAYIDPLADGATLVWGSATARTGAAAGWITFPLTTPFYLPPGMNLLVYCNNQDGSYASSYPSFQYTVQPTNTSVYVYDDGTVFPPTENAYMNGNRPNARFTVTSPSEPYSANDLSLSSVVSPMNVFGQICSEDSSAVVVSITNMGENDYDFTQNPIDVYLDMVDPMLTDFETSVHINTGGLESGKSMMVELMPGLDIRTSGRYDIKAWLSSSIDQVVYDDTIVSQFISGRISLPVDEQFDNGVDPLVFVVSASNSQYQWVSMSQGTGADTAVEPVWGDNMMAFTGTIGASASISVRQMQLQGTTAPTMEFWYFHDTVANDGDYFQIEITADGGSNYDIIAEILKTDPANPYYGWKRYEIDLSPYTVGSCISVKLTAMTMSGGIYQYIDRIRITSVQDVAITQIITSEFDACNLENKTWKVLLANGTPQDINFSVQPTSIQLDIEHTYNGVISNYNFTYPLTGGMLEGNSVDTFELTTGFNLEKGTYNATAYLTAPLDDNPANDTYATAININPQFNIEIKKLSKDAPAAAGFEYGQEITITNTGNMELSDIGLVLSVTSDDGVYTFNAKATFNQALQPNGTAGFTFSQAYTVPWCENYTVKVHGYLMCDSMLFNKDFSVQEAVDMVDLKLVSIGKPADDGATDVAGSLMEVEVNIQNLNPGTGYLTGDAKAGIMLTDTNGNPLQTLPLEDLPSIGAGILNTSTITYPFNGKYTVPNLEEYYLVVYLDKVDQYNQNDTLKLRRSTNYVGLNDLSKASFTMEQNIPNPAKGNTIINYSIPQDGEITFQLYSISGQLLYTEQESVPLGEHQIELNLSNYASGVYFYTMEYKGQRISKRMTVK